MLRWISIISITLLLSSCSVLGPDSIFGPKDEDAEETTEVTDEETIEIDTEEEDTEEVPDISVDKEEDDQEVDKDKEEQELFVTVYLVALEDNGQSGMLIGCGDSLVPVERIADPDKTILSETVHGLLSIREETYGASGLYNALYQSQLLLSNAELRYGVAHIYLMGQIKSGGVCDDPRIEAQLEETIKSVPGVQSVQFYLNGKEIDLKEYFSGRG